MKGTGVPDPDRLLARNNFDLLRLLFAGTVCLVHAYELSGFRELAWIASFLSTAVAVKAFFVVSGFLIFMSHERSTSLASYTGKRIRRIYPAYFAVVMLCALGLALASARPLAEYFSFAWLKYVLANLVFLNFLQPTLPGVFEANHMPAVNGALWTLKIEVMFYVSVPVFAVLFRRVPRLPAIVFVYCASVVYWVLLTAAAERTGSGLYNELARQLPGQLSYFMSGALLYYYLPFFVRHKASFLAAALATLAIDRFVPLPSVEPFALAVVVVLALAAAPSQRVGGTIVAVEQESWSTGTGAVPWHLTIRLDGEHRRLDLVLPHARFLELLEPRAQRALASPGLLPAIEREALKARYSPLGARVELRRTWLGAFETLYYVGPER